MRLLLGGRLPLDALRQIALKLYAIHSALSPRYRVWLLIFWPSRLYLLGGAHVTSNEPCAAATYCCRWSSRPFPQFRCARSPRRRAVQRSYDNPEVVRQPLFAAVTDQSNLPAARQEPLAPS